MFSRIYIFTFPVLAVATSVAGIAPDDTPTDACCSSTIPASSNAGTLILKSLGVNLDNLDVLLGLVCSPTTITGIGPGSGSSGITVSCSEGVMNGIGVGCVAITL